MVSKSSDFRLCPPILRSHLIKACFCIRRKFYNQQNARYTAVVHCTRKHLRPALQLLVNFKLFSYLTNLRNIRVLLLLDYILL